MISKVLIANRGEIALRIIGTCNRMGIRSVSVFSEADSDALHVKEADESCFIGGAAPADSYLRIDKMLDAAKEKGCDAIHPGYGFLSENYRFAEIVTKNSAIDVELDDRLTEIDMGKFTRMNYDDMFAKYGNIFLKFYENDPVIAEHEVETFPNVQKRILDMVDHVIKKHNNENVILVTHMDPIKAMIGKVLSLDPEILFQLIVANASLNIFKYDDQNFYLSSINSMNSSRFHETF